MKVTVLGSGTAVPDGERNSSGYVVETDDVKLLLDCGAGTVHALARYQIEWERLSHIFISHFHVDHIGELAALFFAFRHGMKTGRREPLTVLAPRGLDKIITHLREAFGKNLFMPRFPVDFITLRPNESMPLSSDCQLTVAKTPHTAESLAVRIENRQAVVGYTGDTAFSQEVAQFFHHADLLISECSFKEPVANVLHLSITEAARLATLAQVKRFLVTHFYFEVDEMALKRHLESHFPGIVIIGHDGLQMEIEALEE